MIDLLNFPWKWNNIKWQQTDTKIVSNKYCFPLNNLLIKILWDQLENLLVNDPHDHNNTEHKWKREQEKHQRSSTFHPIFTITQYLNSTGIRRKVYSLHKRDKRRQSTHDNRGGEGQGISDFFSLQNLCVDVCWMWKRSKDKWFILYSNHKNSLTITNAQLAGIKLQIMALKYNKNQLTWYPKQCA